MSDILDRVEAIIELEKGEMKTALQERRRQIELDASQRLAKAKTELMKAAIKAKEAQDLAELEAWAYQAELNAQAAQKKAKELRQRAGHYTKRERAGKVARKTGRVARKVAIVGGRFVEGFGKGVVAPSAKAIGRGAKDWYDHYYDEPGKSSTRRRSVKRKTAKRCTKAKTKR